MEFHFDPGDEDEDPDDVLWGVLNHEAGHAVVALALGYACCVRIKCSWGRYSGETKVVKGRFNKWKALVIHTAGPIAQNLYAPDTRRAAHGKTDGYYAYLVSRDLCMGNRRHARKLVRQADSLALVLLSDHLAAEFAKLVRALEHRMDEAEREPSTEGVRVVTMSSVEVSRVTGMYPLVRPWRPRSQRGYQEPPSGPLNLMYLWHQFPKVSGRLVEEFGWHPLQRVGPKHVVTMNSEFEADDDEADELEQ